MTVPSQPTVSDPDPAVPDELDQATAEMLAAIADVAKMLAQAEPSTELPEDLWEACKAVEKSVAKLRRLRE